MGKFETNQIDLRGDGRIILYQRPDVVKNPKWQCRISVDGSTGYKRFSTKTSDQKEAEKVAIDQYFELQNKVNKGGSLQGVSVKQVYDRWVKTKSFLKVGRSEAYVEQQFTSVEKIAVKFFKNKPIEDITNQDVQEMMSWANEQEKPLRPQGKKRDNTPLSSSTLRGIRSAHNLFFKFALDNGYIDKLPVIPAPALKKNRRPSFTKDEWRRLTNHMRKWVEEPCKFNPKNKKSTRGMNGYDKKRYRERFYVQHYILVMGNTGIRVGEMRNVCWNDLDRVVVGKGDERLIFSVDGKTGKRDVVANAGVETYVRRIYEFRRDEIGVTDEEFNRNEPIFCHPNGNSVGDYRGSYNGLLEGLGMRKGKNGDNRTIYSLRHTYATMRINEVPIYQLAMNMGTSVEMIEDYYSHAKVRSKEFATTMTQGNQKGGKKALPF